MIVQTFHRDADINIVAQSTLGIKEKEVGLRINENIPLAN